MCDPALDRILYRCWFLVIALAVVMLVAAALVLVG